ncbi:DUF4350 domain-containing protein [Kineococcus sp. LSe6-4]|uniref:DUF4350 domain-containing protein n=1 Tax=Kineococcus halophytocola TaxID=3234027 RepID=A0ABV4H1W2_9ACTN
MSAAPERTGDPAGVTGVTGVTGVAGLVRRHRGAALLVLVVLATAVLVTLLTPRTEEAVFSPASAAPAGGRAVARVLADQGVRTEEARSFDAALGGLAGAAGRDVTLLVTQPDLLSGQRWDRLVATGADLVVLRPDAGTLDALTDSLAPTGEASSAVRDPGCDLPAARAAGPARAGGLTYAASAGATACYGGSYVQAPLREGPGTLTVLGQPSLLTNRWAAQDGNAALALWTLGAHRDLVWYLPDPLDTDSPTVPLTALLPPWLGPAVGVLGLAGVVLLLWRGRRLGRLVEEPLPVLVRAAETVEGHGRLYASARAAGRAARALREATARRLRAATGLDPQAGVSDVADQVAWVTGRPAPAVRELLAGADPRDDPALVRLALDLDALERDVRAGTAATHPTHPSRTTRPEDTP